MADEGRFVGPVCLAAAGGFFRTCLVAGAKLISYDLVSWLQDGTGRTEASHQMGCVHSPAHWKGRCWTGRFFRHDGSLDLKNSPHMSNEVRKNSMQTLHMFVCVRVCKFSGFQMGICSSTAVYADRGRVGRDIPSRVRGAA